ncbi:MULTISPECIES: helix-turn-helix domain-containing protein [Burkholderia]|nr:MULTISPECIES: helix-turn-helix transcriptional regulator [Burkholderia]
MNTLNMSKKPAEQVALQDWHRADIKAALEKAGWSLRRLSMAHGYTPGALKNALDVPWPKAESIIAATIGVPRHLIWPSRYHIDGTARSGRGERGFGRRKAVASTECKSITRSDACNVNCAGGA